MKFLAAFLLSVAALFGQTCASQMSTSSLTFNAPSYGPRGPAQTIALTPSAGGAWSITSTPFSPIRMIMNDATNNISGTGNATIYAYMFGGTTEQAPVNGLMATGTFQLPGPSGPQNCPFTITANILARSTPTLTNNAGVADSALPRGSSSGAWVMSGANDLISPSQIGSLPGGSHLLPAWGSTITMPEWGTTLRNCSPGFADGQMAGFNNVYSSVAAMNSDDSLIYMQRHDGHNFFASFPACNAIHEVVASPTVAGSQWMWDRTHNNIGYYYYTNQIYTGTVNLSTFAVSTTASYTFACSGGSCPASIGSGSTDDLSDDGWLTFTSNMDHSGNTSNPMLCMIQVGVWLEHCSTDLATRMPNVLAAGTNYAMGSKGFSSVTGYRYAFTNPQNPGPNVNYGGIWKMKSGDTNLTFDKYMGLGSEIEGIPSGNASNYTDQTCIYPTNATVNKCMDPNQHAATVADAAGHQYLVQAGGLNGEENVGTSGGNIFDFDASAANMTLSKAMGGGVDHALLTCNGCGTEVGSSSPWAYIRMNDAGTFITNWLITNAVTSGSTIVLTLDSAPGAGLVTGNPASVNGVAGCTNANGTYASVTVSGSTVTLPGVTCNGAYSSATGAIVNNTYPSSASFRQEVVAVKIVNGSPVEQHRIGSFLGTALFRQPSIGFVL